MGNRSYAGTVLWDVVDAAAWGSKNYMLRGLNDCKQMCTLHAVFVLGWCCVFVTMLPDTIDDSSTSTRGLYLRSSQLCLIKRVRDFKEVSYLNLWHSYSSFF
jgi:hypothetical protein